MKATPFKPHQTIRSQHWCKETVSQTLTQCHFVSDKAETSDYFISFSIPMILPSRILFLLNCFLSAVSHLEPEGYFIQSSVVRCICLTFYGSSKGCMSPKFRGIYRMCPLVKGLSVWVQNKILQICSSFKKSPARIKITQLVCRLTAQSSIPFSLNRRQNGQSISCFGKSASFIKQQLLQSLGRECFFCILMHRL